MFPEFFQLTPQQYRDMVAELTELRKLTDNPHGLVRYAWKRKQAEFPGASKQFKAAIRQAYMRGHLWELTPRQYENLIAHPCYRCGGPIGNGVGLDRQDNKKGYSLDNVEPCCGPCNVGRNYSVKGLTRSP
jgi:hypothetical protein